MLRQACRVVADDEHELLRQYLVTAREMVEAESGLTLVRKSIRERLMAWPCRPLLMLSLYPVITIDSVQYVDKNGATQTLDSSLYTQGLGHRPAWIVSAEMVAWPELAKQRPDAITIAYTAGHDPADKPAPESAKQAIMLLAAHWYRNREAGVVGTTNSVLELGVDRLIDLLKLKGYP